MLGIALLAGAALYLFTRPAQATDQSAQVPFSELPYTQGGGSSEPGPQYIFNVPPASFPPIQPDAPGKKEQTTYGAGQWLGIPLNYKAQTDAIGNVIGFTSPEGESYTTKGANIVYGSTLSNVFIDPAGKVTGVTDAKKQMSYATQPTTLENVQAGGQAYLGSGQPVYSSGGGSSGMSSYRDPNVIYSASGAPIASRAPAPASSQMSIAPVYQKKVYASFPK